MEFHSDIAQPSNAAPLPEQAANNLSVNLPSIEKSRLPIVWSEIEPPSIDKSSIASKIAAHYGISNVAAEVYAHRGFKPGKKLERFIQPELNQIESPWSLKNMDRAVDLLCKSIESGKKIGICCDFDADGASSAAILIDALRAFGAKWSVDSPDRFKDGYGLNRSMVRTMRRRGCSTLVCLDFGTTNEAELKLAQKLGMKAMVVDHHETLSKNGKIQFPVQSILVNPKQPGCGFDSGRQCTAGLTWLLVNALHERLLNSKSKEVRAKAADYDPAKALDLASIGTIADVVPLLSGNRVIAKYGLDVFSQSKRPGIKAMREVAGISGAMKAEDVAFRIGPMLNATGRMEKKGALLAIKTLIAQDKATAEEYALKLFRYNSSRKEQERIVVKKALASVDKTKDLPSVSFVADPDFHEGIIGLAASRLVDSFHRPAFVLSIGENGIAKGSVRSIEGVHVAKVLHTLRRFLRKYGGHEMAGGFSIEVDKIEPFKKALIAECDKLLKGKNLTPRIKTDAEVTFADLKADSHRIIQNLEGFAPCGNKNPPALLLARGVQVVSARLVKGRHLFVVLKQGDCYLEGYLWHKDFHPDLVMEPPTQSQSMRDSAALFPQLDRLVDIAFKPTLERKNPHNHERDRLRLELVAVQKSRL